MLHTGRIVKFECGHKGRKKTDLNASFFSSSISAAPLAGSTTCSFGTDFLAFNPRILLLKCQFLGFQYHQQLQLAIQIQINMSTTSPRSEPPIVPPIVLALSFLWPGASTSGTLAPVVRLMHAKNVMFTFAGRGVSGMVMGAELFDAGIFKISAAVLL